MNNQASPAKTARRMKIITDPTSVSRARGNMVATTKLLVQLVNVASDAAVPIMCKG